MAQTRRRSSGFARFWRIFIFVVIFACMAWSIWDANRDKFAPKGECTIHFIDIGQGDAALIITDVGSVLVDAGPSDSAGKLLEYVKRYTKTVDWLVLTHPHEDHIGGASRVLDGIPVSHVLMTGTVSDTPTYAGLLDALEKSDAEVVEAAPGYAFTLGTSTFTVLAPVTGTTYEETNDTSIVLRLEVSGIRALFTGDIGEAAEGDLLASYPAEDLVADLLKVGHHGSSTSTTEAFLAAVRPKYAAVSCGSGNDYGHPHTATLNRLAAHGVTVCRTDVSGTLVATVKAGKITWKTEK